VTVAVKATDWPYTGELALAPRLVVVEAWITFWEIAVLAGETPKVAGEASPLYTAVMVCVAMFNGVVT
jgi:hypothetical protein